MYTIKEYSLQPLDELDKECLISINEFKEDCKLGYITTYDGFGVYATETHATDLLADPEDFIQGNIRSDFKYVCWYNK